VDLYQPFFYALIECKNMARPDDLLATIDELELDCRERNSEH
jgi:hypothetical protein